MDPTLHNSLELRLTLILTYLLTDLFSHAGHTQHCKIQSVDFQMGLYLQTILTHILVSGIVDILRLNW